MNVTQNSYYIFIHKQTQVICTQRCGENSATNANSKLPNKEKNWRKNLLYWVIMKLLGMMH